jgi:hypothetical protein
MRSLRSLLASIGAEHQRSAPEVRPADSVGAHGGEYEIVDPDGRLVSERGAVRIWVLDPQHATLPNDSILYISRDYPEMQFRFTFARCVDGSYRAYIRSQPNYRGLHSDMAATHRLIDPRNGQFICWQPAPRDAVTILKVARLWAERTARYIATGTRLEAP